VSLEFLNGDQAIAQGALDADVSAATKLGQAVDGVDMLNLKFMSTTIVRNRRTGVKNLFFCLE